jgi:hypothetical protein
VLVAITVVVSGGGAASTSHAQADLFETAASVPPASSILGPGAVRSRAVRIDFDLLSDLRVGEEVVLNLFDDLSATAVLQRTDWRFPKGYALVGGIETEPPGQFVLFKNGKTLAGFIRAPGRGTYRVRPGAGTLHLVEEIDDGALPPCGNGVQEAFGAQGAVAGGPTCDDGSVVDVLVVYTPIARQAAGGTNAIYSIVAAHVADANAAYVNSNVNTQLNMVAAEEVDYDEGGSYGTHLARLAEPSDGYMDEAHVLRELYLADLVALIVNDSEYCGIANLMWPFSVNTWYCNLIMAHELGHNFGCCHAIGDGGGCFSGGVFPYSNGYRFYGNSGPQWRTVMAYAPGNRIPYFSNPNILYDGQPTGIPEGQPGAADNARTINETRSTIANFRAAVPVKPVMYVDANATGTGNGTTWGSAFTDLGVALSVAACPLVEELWVSAGTYTPAPPGGDRNATFQLAEGVSIYGGFPPGGGTFGQRDPAAHPTVLSGDLDGDDLPGFVNNDENSYHVVTASNIGDTAVLDGFTITGGNADGSAPDDRGGGMYNSNGGPAVINCTFRASHAQSAGGGMGNFSGSNPSVINCLFSDNSAGTGSGGGIHNDNSSPTLVNCTISANVAGSGGGCASDASSSPAIANSVLWGNVNGAITGPATVTYSCVEGGWPGNIGADALFANPAVGEYHLSAGSPCIDAGDNTAVPGDVTTDLEGGPRFIDDPNTVDSGVGTPPIVDMGAYEYLAACVAFDINGDGDVGIVDFLQMLADWGPCGGCPADTDGDGDVGVQDFLGLLAHWGPCP